MIPDKCTALFKVNMIYFHTTDHFERLMSLKWFCGCETNGENSNWSFLLRYWFRVYLMSPVTLTPGIHILVLVNIRCDAWKKMPLPSYHWWISWCALSFPQRILVPAQWQAWFFHCVFLILLFLATTFSLYVFFLTINFFPENYVSQKENFFV